MTTPWTLHRPSLVPRPNPHAETTSPGPSAHAICMLKASLVPRPKVGSGDRDETSSKTTSLVPRPNPLFPV